jgi:hypothetical protein
MRDCLKVVGGAVFALMLALVFSVRAADTDVLNTNTVVLGEPGTLVILTPKDWTMSITNVSLKGNPPTVDLYSANRSVGVRLTIYWDGFNGSISKLADPQMDTIVSNVAVREYVAISVEKSFVVEKFQGPKVTGAFARFTDAHWTPMMKDDYKNVATGMFHCGNIWGNFNLVSNDKNGPAFDRGLEVLKSFRRQP